MPVEFQTPLIDEMVKLSGPGEESALVRAFHLNYVHNDCVNVFGSYVRSYPHLAVRVSTFYAGIGHRTWIMTNMCSIVYV